MFEVCYLDYENHTGELDARAEGRVKSIKNFPIFRLDGMKYVFKPLSRTKPLTTGGFAIAEVFWSEMLRKYFPEVRVLPYRLAVCRGYAKASETRYDYGTIVPHFDETTGSGADIQNAYHYFTRHPESGADIRNYINYCGIWYDWTKILKSPDLAENPAVASQAALHVLASMLTADQNFHYENMHFVCRCGEIADIVPMTDHEFSSFFLYHDTELYLVNERKFREGITGRKEDGRETAAARNLRCICRHHKKEAECFAEHAEDFADGMMEMTECLRSGYLASGFASVCTSLAWQAGHARFKDADAELAEALEKKEKEAMKRWNPESSFLFTDIMTDEITAHARALASAIRKELHGDR